MGYTTSDNDDFPDDSQDSLLTTHYKVGTLVYKRRQRAKIIRFVRYDEEKDRENYCRERLLLFHPWRSEDQLLGEFKTYQDCYSYVKYAISEKECQYNHGASVIDIVESADLVSEETT